MLRKTEAKNLHDVCAYDLVACNASEYPRPASHKNDTGITGGLSQLFVKYTILIIQHAT